MVNNALWYADARAVRPYEVGTANFGTPPTINILRGGEICVPVCGFVSGIFCNLQHI